MNAAPTVLGFALQAGGVVMVVIAAFVYDEEAPHPRLGWLVWGGVGATSLGSLLVLGSLIAAAIAA